MLFFADKINITIHARRDVVKKVLLLSFFVVAHMSAMDTPALRAQEGINRYAIQVAALVAWSEVGPDRASLKNLDYLVQNGLDIDYDYTEILKQLGVKSLGGISVWSPTLLLAVSGETEVAWPAIGIRAIKEYKANINKGTNEFIPSMKALYYFSEDLVPVYLDHPQFNVHHKDEAQNTHLHCCFGRGITTNRFSGRAVDFEKCKLMCVPLQKLMDMGADPSAENKEKETPISLAVTTGYEPFLKILIQSYKANESRPVGLLTAS